MKLQPFECNVGDEPRIEGSFETLVLNPDGDEVMVPVDPQTVTFRIRKPDGDIRELVYGTDVAVVRDKLGVYHVDQDADAAGVWYYRIFSTGSGQGAFDGLFRVRQPNF